MTKTLSIFKPYLHIGILQKEEGREKIKYLKVPGDMGYAELNQDIEKGAVQFAELKALVEKENEPQYILITCDNLEYAYMAVTYLAASFNEKHGVMCHVEKTNPEYASSNLDRWEEDAFAIPIIEKTELEQYMCNENSPFGFGNMSFIGDQRCKNEKPYWTSCVGEAVCILCEDRGFYYGNRDIDDNVMEGFQYFQNNKKVYIINYQQPNRMHEFCDEEGNSFDDDDFLNIEEDSQRAKWNYAILSFRMDEIDLNISKENLEKYYKLVLQSIFHKNELIVKKGFSYKKLIHLISAMKEPDKCQLMENIVKYAVKDFSTSTPNVITNESFAFMERFVRINEKTKRNSNRNQNAKEKLVDGLLGMDSVKQQVLNVVNVLKFNRIRERMHISGGGYHNAHVMLGAPGTAKTTVAQIMGEIMTEEGLLEDNRYICINGAELKGKYVGHSAPKTKEIFENNDIIVIDEAYSLVSDTGEQDCFSKEAIAQLIIELENHSKEKLIIFAGYGGKNVNEKNNKMKAFLDANPGIKSRITSTIYFDSYTPEEMVNIFFHIAKKQNYIVEESVAEAVRKHFEKRVLDENFGNGREARSLLETAVVYTANRIFGLEKKTYSKADMKHITEEDVRKAIRQVEEGEEIRNAKKMKMIGFGV
ncbi:MAG: AAA family ATPase [Lachnospiraceae bacterium]|nr:AAA family ATPase [Lachnospiraceae bacterium]